MAITTLTLKPEELRGSLKLELLKLNRTEGSLLIRVENRLNLWVDFWYEGSDLTIDWNKYIFFLHSETDLQIREFQNNADNFMEVLEFVELILTNNHRET